MCTRAGHPRGGGRLVGRPEHLRLMPPRTPSGRFLPAGPPLDPRSAGARVARQLLRQARQASGLLTAPRQRGLDGASTARQLDSQGSSEKCRERPLPPLYPRPVCGHAHGSEFSHIASGAGGGLAHSGHRDTRRHGSTLASSRPLDLSPGLDNSTGNSTDTRQILDRTRQILDSNSTG